MRFLMYSHDGAGLGHIRRNAAVAAAIVERAPQASVLLATGADQADRFVPAGNVEILKLPAIQKAANERYVARRLGVDEHHIREIRSAILGATVRSYRPTVLLADKHPLGARGELRAGLMELQRAGGRAVLGLRDILDDRATVLSEWSANGTGGAIDRHYDEVLIYGDARILDPISEYEFPSTVADRTHFCGYVLDRPGMTVRSSDGARREDDPRPSVLATAGGGEDGAAMIEAAIAACSREWRLIVVSGPLVSLDERARLRALAAAADVEFHEFVPNVAGWLGHVDAILCLGGYNTLVEAVAAGTPIVCVPREVPRVEQLIRARAFERLGLLRMIRRAELTPDTLRAQIAAALAAPSCHGTPRPQHALDLHGAGRAADRLLALAEDDRLPKEDALHVSAAA